MWTLWLVSKVFHRLSLRNQSSVHSSPARHISGMKYKYSTARERSTRVMQGGVIGQLHFFRGNSENMSPWCSLYPTFSLSLVLYLRHTAHNIGTHTHTYVHTSTGTYTHTISYENISPTSKVQRLRRQCKSPQRAADQRRGLHTTCLTDRPPWNPLASLHEYNPTTGEVKGRNTPEAFCVCTQSS